MGQLHWLNSPGISRTEVFCPEPDINGREALTELVQICLNSFKRGGRAPRHLVRNGAPGALARQRRQCRRCDPQLKRYIAHAGFFALSFHSRVVATEASLLSPPLRFPQLSCAGILAAMPFERTRASKRKCGVSSGQIEQTASLGDPPVTSLLLPAKRERLGTDGPPSASPHLFLSFPLSLLPCFLSVSTIPPQPPFVSSGEHIDRYQDFL